MNPIMTIGYEKASLEDFIGTLHHLGVQVLIDVRAVPASRKRGFSKGALFTQLKEHRIEYTHLRALGDPKEGREAAKRGDRELFESIFRTHLRTQEAQAGIDEAIRLATRAQACLLCYERNHRICHRSIIAEEMALRVGDMAIRHSEVRHGISHELKQENLLPAFG